MRKRMAFSDAFAAALQKRRLEKKLSRQSLAEKAGLHQTYIGMIERGLSNPSLDAANSIAEAMQVPLSKLVGEAERIRQREQG